LNSNNIYIAPETGNIPDFSIVGEPTGEAIAPIAVTPTLTPENIVVTPETVPHENIAVTANPATPNAPAVEVTQTKQPEQPKIYGDIPPVPTQTAIEGIKFDFNDGIRVQFPATGNYRVCFSDIDTGIILYNTDVEPNAMVTSVKKFFIKFRLEIFRQGETEAIFTHDYDAKKQEVMIQLPVGTIGDSIGWFSYVERFQQKHQCKVLCVMTPWIADLVRDQYPNIKFIEAKDTLNYKPYACYYMGLFFKGNVDNQPTDFRYIGLHRTAGYILGVDPSDIPPRFKLDAPRTIKEPYVCIAVQSSSQAKYWNNPDGWREIVKFLKTNGYRVICIDKAPAHGNGIVWNHIPNGAEDFTGDIPLQERVNLLKDADFFIGLSSGLSWLAWCCKIPVVMISGFTHPTNEFHTPYRVINYHTCNSCWNDMRIDFDHFDFLWCPRHKNTERHFECTRLISADHVKNIIKKLPEFQEQEKLNKK
jgi:autotransporter strand-loop-strand O-heptosyltransferase